MIGQLINGAYWYVVPCITQVISGETWRTPGNLPDGGFSFWHADEFGKIDDLFVVRSPEPVDIAQSINMSVYEIVGDKLPHAKVNGE